MRRSDFRASLAALNGGPTFAHSLNRLMGDLSGSLWIDAEHAKCNS